MKQLIITADDFGFSEGVTDGILKSMLEGAVSCTSVMVACGDLERIKEKALLIEGRIGLHLQITNGTPFCRPETVKSLVTDQGIFPYNWRQLKEVDQTELYQEWQEQIEQLLRLDIVPTYLDTHHNVHRFPAVFEVYIELAKKYDLPVRPLSKNMLQRYNHLKLQSTDICYESWCGMNVTPQSFIAHVLGAFRQIGNKGIVEFMCHPAFADEQLAKQSLYVKEREAELAVLCDPLIKEYLNKHNIQLLDRVPFNTKEYAEKSRF
ncbi:hypothetical protein BC749_10383 [Flavobacterium araucananum]|uniref:Carbohydrate deacetylase n=1 Tax=Flavobacterium araucananum TaxID=946678 RepID=A0A227PGR6_9FLAO|nr:ChbG/HpnK family deacetylase [Flavobacterium araucananum]OXG09101.1 hypothetical protein B0A64_03655 [Flavobacterium araucananum]PWJ99705.1 hypothetical protein BC749_10383 [Flavobacterium araucananum]